MQLDLTYGGPGCEYKNNFPEDVGKWIPAIYTRTPYSNGAVLSRTFSFDRIQIMIRHQNDPYVFAQKLTQGTLSFGLTPGQKLALGLALMAVGGFFILPCCGFVALLAYCFRQKRHGHHYEPVSSYHY